MADYLYNGLPLLKIPDAVTPQHPHVVLRYFDYPDSATGHMDTVVANYLSDVNIEQNGSLFYLILNVGDMQSKATRPADSTGDFSAFGEIAYQEERQTAALERVVWTNTDLYLPDGTLYLAASEPVPILAPTIEPLSMWMGWKAGNWVARQRGKA